MTSVVIAAHNESTHIGYCLDELLRDARPGEFDVTVVANGCTDDTAQVASARPDVRVIELEQAGKAPALNAGDRVAVGFPRIYLDADIVIHTSVARAVRDALEHDPSHPLAAFPVREIDTSASDRLVRDYYAINSRLPVFRTGLFGRGMIALSEQGRRRFDDFPTVVADDLFLDSLFTTSEKLLVETVATVVVAPVSIKPLLDRLVRVRRGNARLRTSRESTTALTNVIPSRPMSWLRGRRGERPATRTLRSRLRRHHDGGGSARQDATGRQPPLERLRWRQCSLSAGDTGHPQSCDSAQHSVIQMLGYLAYRAHPHFVVAT